MRRYDEEVFGGTYMSVSEQIILDSNVMFDDVLEMIHIAKQKAEYQVNTTIIDLD